MLLNKIIQRNYTSFSLYYQIKLPLDLEISIPSDDPVRLVSAFVEEMDLSELYKTYGRIRKNQATPRQILKLVIYAAMNRIYSSRDIRKACKRDINFMYLLEGMPAPDHATIARFISLHFSVCAKTLLAQMSDLLYLLGEISGKTIFIDGTKIESAANKYTFVWKKAITKNQARLYTKLSSFVAECEELYGMKTVYHDSISIHTLKRLKKQLCRIKIQEEIVFVHGTGRRKTQLQKSLEQLDWYLEKLKEYTKKLYTLGDRNSYSKTDPDATFMRMKEDAMLNGQLKPAYNIQHGVDSEYITWIDISPRPTDTRTLIPFLKDMESYLGFKYSEIVADAGYESEENYLFIESNGQTAYIKPQNYEISKTRKYKKDISRRENMEYHADRDSYIRRGYPLSVFEEAVRTLRAIGISVIVHTILYLPGESKAQMLETIEYLNLQEIQGIKLQLLHVLRDTDLYNDYQRYPFPLPSMEEYLDFLGTCLCALRPDIVVHRLTGDGPKPLLVAPLWTSNKRLVLNQMGKVFKEKDIWQGKTCRTL